MWWWLEARKDALLVNNTWVTRAADACASEMAALIHVLDLGVKVEK